MNWSVTFFSPFFHSSQVSRFFSFFETKYPSDSSLGVIASELRILMQYWSIFVFFFALFQDLVQYFILIYFSSSLDLFSILDLILTSISQLAILPDPYEHESHCSGVFLFIAIFVFNCIYFMPRIVSNNLPIMFLNFQTIHNT